MNRLLQSIASAFGRRVLCALCICCLASLLPLKAQTLSWENFIERMTADEENEYTAWQYLYDELCELHEHPLNINTATREQLERLPFLSPELIEHLLAYLYSYGPMKTLGELQLVESMDYDTRQLLSLFVYAGDKESSQRTPSLKEMLRQGKHELVTRLDIPLYERAGYKEYSDSILQRYPNRKYAGDPYYHSLRYTFNGDNHLYAGLVAEKDAGEPFFTKGRKGYDFYSYYLMLKDIGCIETLIVGNYRLKFGQGLVMNTDFSLGKTAAVSSLNSLSRGIRRHSSTGEDNFFHGIAGTVRLGRWLLTTFYSNKKQDATLKQDSTIQIEPFITSFKTDGYHRTPLEISKRGNISNELFGSNLTYSHGALRMGITGVYNVFNRLLKPGDEAYRRYYPAGRSFYAVGVDYSYFHHRFSLVGETAIGKKGMATLNAFRYRLSSQWRAVLIQRYYSKDYNALYANAFGESSYVRNESGWYIGVEASPLRKVELTGYIDIVRFPYLTYQASALSSRGLDGLLQVVYRPGKRTSWLLRYRYKNKGKDFKLENGKKGLDAEIQQKVRLQWHYLPTEALSLKTTADYAQVDFVGKESERGYMLTQNLSYHSEASPIGFDVAMAYFSTDSYAARLSMYERGLIYSFSFPSFYYQGLRAAALLRYDFNTHLSLLAKYGCTKYFDRETIGSSQQLIDGSVKQDVQLQLLLKI